MQAIDDFFKETQTIEFLQTFTHDDITFKMCDMAADNLFEQMRKMRYTHRFSKKKFLCLFPNDKKKSELARQSAIRAQMQMLLKHTYIFWLSHNTNIKRYAGGALGDDFRSFAEWIFNHTLSNDDSDLFYDSNYMREYLDSIHRLEDL